MLNAVRIANFKAFGSSQRVPLRPITLLYGVNSAGKSSVLHALALAHHAVETGDLDTLRTRIGGDSIDLGGFRQYVHRRQRDHQVVLAFELNPRKLSGRVADLLQGARKIVIELGIGASGATESAPDASVHVERFALEIDDLPMLSMSARRGGLLRLDRLDHAHPVFRKVFGGILTLVTTTHELSEEDIAGLADVLNELVPSVTARQQGLFPRIEDDSDSERGESGGNLMPISKGRRQEDLAQATMLFLPRAVRDLVDGLSATLETQIRRLVYLGPLRSYPPRHLAFSQHHAPNWFAGGGYAWDIVRTRDDVRKRVNQWLGDAERLKTPYELQVRNLVPAETLQEEVESRLEVTLHDLAVDLIEQMESGQHSEALDAALEAVRKASGREEGIDEATLVAAADVVDSLVDAEAVTHDWVKAIVAARSESLRDLVLIDKRSGTPVSHRDVGIGVSQVLPVLVSAYASSERLLAIEQPEIHLHPGLQAELGDVVIESALGDLGNRFLIETHSEHLLLRIMRRIRQSASGDLPQGVPAVRPDDVMVLFVEPDGAHSLVREMPLNERGELAKAWPGGFFEEGMREIF